MRLRDQTGYSDTFATLRPFHEPFYLKATKLVARTCSAIVQLIPYDLPNDEHSIDSRHRNRETVSITTHWARPVGLVVAIVVMDWHADNTKFWICIARLYKHLCGDDDPSYISLSKPTARTMGSKVRRIEVSSKSGQRKSFYPNRNLFRCSITRTPKIKSQRRLSIRFAEEK